MAEDREEGTGKRPGGWVWDQQKQTWVEATEAPSKEPDSAAPSEAVPEEVKLEEIPVEAMPEDYYEAEAPTERITEYKGTLIRFAGALVDLVILLIISFIVGLIVRQFVSPIPFWATAIYGLLYFVGFWSWRGQTPGKMLTGARVVRRDGSPAGVGWSLLRYVFYLMPFFGPIVVLASQVSNWFALLLPLVTLVVMALTREKRGIHDFVAGTVVINTRPQARQSS